MRTSPVRLLFSLLLSLLLPLAAALPLLARQAVDTALRTSPFCLRPAPWNQIFTFFLTNYVARIATIKKESGSRGQRGYITAAQSLFVPFIGISTAANTISRGSRFFGHDDVDRALLAEALCAIVRDDDWTPMHGEIIKGCQVIGGDPRALRKLRKRHRRQRRKGDAEKFQQRAQQRERAQYLGGGQDAAHAYSAAPSDAEDSDGGGGDDHEFSRNMATLVINRPGVRIIDRDGYKIQGHMTLPAGYALAMLPPGTELMALAVSGAVKSEIVISNSYGVVKAFTGMVQIVSSLYVLYTAYGQQITRYGYAAFGFTVLPYTIMSILNVLGNLVEASYDCLFLVRSDVMVQPAPPSCWTLQADVPAHSWKPKAA